MLRSCCLAVPPTGGTQHVRDYGAPVNTEFLRLVNTDQSGRSVHPAPLTRSDSKALRGETTEVRLVDAPDPTLCSTLPFDFRYDWSKKARAGRFPIAKTQVAFECRIAHDALPSVEPVRRSRVAT